MNITSNRKEVTSKECISSRNHPSIKRIRNLHLRAERDKTRSYYVEGIRFVSQAVTQGIHIETLVFAPELLVHPFGQRLIRQQRRAGVPCLAVTPDVLQSIALNDDPQGIGAVVRQRWEPLSHIQPQQDLCWLAFDTVHSPGNLGTIIRTGEAVGAAGIILIGDTVDAYNPATVRATMGAMFTQRFVRTDVDEFKRWKQQHHCLLVGTSPGATVEYHTISYPAPVVLFMGDERKGLSPAQQSLCDVMVQIPMVGHNDSLNLAIATGIMLYEVFRQRRALAA